MFETVSIELPCHLMSKCKRFHKLIYIEYSSTICDITTNEYFR